MMLRVGTRGSALAVAQTQQSLRSLVEASGCEPPQILTISTTGDQIQDRPLREAGGKGLFVKELDEALLDGRIDCAVHSLKDVPSELPEGVVLGAVLCREDSRDVLLSRQAVALESFPAGSVLGTTSLRRAAQALALNAGLKVTLLRGNVATRMAKVSDGVIDLTFLARAGLNRLGISAGALSFSDQAADRFVPAVGQGAVAFTVRADDTATRSVLASVNDPESELAVRAERAFAAVFGGGCHLPLAGNATLKDGRIVVTGMVASPDGSRVLRGQREGDALNVSTVERLGQDLAEDLLGQGAAAILAEVSELS